MTRREDVFRLNLLEPDLIGYIFYPPSPRFVGEEPDPELFSIPQAGIKKTGVFVNEPAEALVAKARAAGLDTLQLHGEEDPALCRRLRKEGFTVIRALPFSAEHRQQWQAYRGAVDFLLWDTPTKQRGGSGRQFDWSQLDPGIDIPFFLSGGIGPDDAQTILALDHAFLAGIDINSRFELGPGIKDLMLIGEFFKIIRNDQN